MEDPAAEPNRAHYYSRVRATLLPRSIGLTIMAFGVLFIALALAQRRIDFLLVPLIMLPTGSFVAFMTVTVRADQREVVITFCDIFKRILQRDEIATITTDNAVGINGYGLRYMGPGMVGYLVGGPEVSITMNNGKTVIASTDRPEQLICLLSEENK
ncbi:MULTISPECIES: hypothetical protein [Paenarthrobacter]|jgi:hypothetical protein|uniref:hypothetical protein n=1 Tax=Paenarthrobacter TaxID=1742992 RepID=UPI002366C515|nr:MULTISPECIES: hypothetical protein [Paenarthrobacter]MDD7835793.1 hypothetical protein [Paenarthrobacter sp. AB444]MDP9934599.1 hypothetical protein [Paenarthrobacter nicotinovorans]